MQRNPVPRTPAAVVAVWSFAVIAWAGACDRDRQVTGPEESASPLIVSDPALSVALPSGEFAVVLADANRNYSPLAAGSGALTRVVFISLPPGTIPTGTHAILRTRRTGTTVTVQMVAGGFDPVDVQAEEDDVIEIEVHRTGDLPPLRFAHTVPRSRPPKVVRTNPPRGKRDVVLNSRISVVFSEPMEARTVTAQSLQLLRGATPVAGRIEFEDPDYITASFVPNEPLAAGTQYRVVVSRDVHDLDGEALEEAVSAEFTTEFTTAVTPSPSLIAFMTPVDDRSSSGEIYVMNPDGTNVRRLTNSGGESGKPAWSPDGKRLAFFRASSDQTASIYLINADGSGVTRVTNDWRGVVDQHPAWSPDGQRIAFTRRDCTQFDQTDGQRHCVSTGSMSGADWVYDWIYVVNADGSGVMRLTDGVDPAWSPDGSRIVFSKRTREQWDIYVMNDDGSGVTRLTETHHLERGASWSPDGSRIAFQNQNAFVMPGAKPEVAYFGTEIHVMTSDGSRRYRLTDEWGYSPAWSPDGSKIVFAGSGPEGSGLYVMNAYNGAGVTFLGASGDSPAWSPPGTVAPRRPPPATSLQKPVDNGDGQTDTVLATLTEPLRVQVFRDGAPAPGILVSWTIRGQGSGSSLSSSTTTDASGIAATTLTFGCTPRGYVVEASVPGAAGSPVVFGARALPGKFGDLAVAQGNDQVGVRGGSLPESYIVRPVDRCGNTVDTVGVAIGWAIGSGGGQIAPTFGTIAVRTLGPDVGQQTATATAPGAPAVTFTAFAADAVINVGTMSDTGWVSTCDESFVPSAITVPRGSTVAWRWVCGPHDVTFEDDPTQPIRLRTFTAAGTYRYRCTVHSTSFTAGAAGTVTVLP